MESIKKTAGENLRRICKIKGIRNYQVADYMGVTTSSVSHWFKGDNFLDIDNLYKLSQFLGVTLDQIFGLSPIVVGILNNDEEEIISAYRKASPEEQNVIRRALNLPDRKKTSAEVI
jgi:transcriptional regulator with XRE-family HTH domain